MKKLILAIFLCVPLLGAAFTANEQVTSTKLNTLNNANIDSAALIDPEKIDDHSATTSEQDETSDPYVGDAQTLAASLRDEIKQFRFQIAQIIQANVNAAASQKWYNDPANYLGAPASLTQGDVFFYNRAGDVARLAAGSDGNFLKSQGANSDVAWGSALSMPASTTQGDVLYVSIGNALARLAAGTSGQSLKTQGANQNPVWSNFIANPASTTQGDILYVDASNTWARLAASTSGNALVSQGSNYNPKWGAAAGGGRTHTTGSGSGAQTLNWSSNLTISFTLTGNVTFSFTAPTAGEICILRAIQDATGSRTITWPTIKWPGGVAPIISTAPNYVDIFTFLYDGTNYSGIGFAIQLS